MHRKKIDDTFKAVRIFLTWIGRFPFSFSPDGEYLFNWKGLKAILFYFTTLFFFFLVVSGFWGYLCLQLTHHTYKHQLVGSEGHNCSDLGTMRNQEECEVTEQILDTVQPRVVFLAVVLAIVLNVMT